MYVTLVLLCFISQRVGLIINYAMGMEREVIDFPWHLPGVCALRGVRYMQKESIFIGLELYSVILS